MYSRLEQQNALLADGPICVGECHNQSAARKELFQLIDKGNVTKLFLEIPACSSTVQEFLANPDTRLDGSEPQEVKNYIANMTMETAGDNREIPWSSIISYAKEHRISVYGDDLPMIDSCFIGAGKKLEYTLSGNNSGESFDVDPTGYFNKILKEQQTSVRQMSRVRSKLTEARGLSVGVRLRNEYSEAIVKKFTDGLSPAEMKGVVIFGGIDHFNDNYKSQSLQNLCQINSERLFSYYIPTAKTQPRIAASSYSIIGVSIFNDNQNKGDHPLPTVIHDMGSRK